MQCQHTIITKSQLMKARPQCPIYSSSLSTDRFCFLELYRPTPLCSCLCSWLGSLAADPPSPDDVRAAHRRHRWTVRRRVVWPLTLPCLMMCGWTASRGSSKHCCSYSFQLTNQISLLKILSSDNLWIMSEV